MDEQLESAREPVNQELPTPKFTEVSADKQTSTADPKALAKEVAGILLPEIEKRIQSTKDRRFDKLEKALGVQELEDLGVQLTPEQRMELRMRDIEARSSSVQEASPGRGVSQDGAQGTQFDGSALLKEIGLDGNDPDVIAEWAKPHRNLDHLKAELQAVRIRHIDRPASTAASAPSAQGGGARTEETLADVRKQYDEELKKVRRGDIQTLSNIQAKYRKRGLEL